MSDNIDIAEYEQRVRLRAYWLWESEGRPGGRHVEHWLIAETAEREPAVAEAAVAPEAVVAAPEPAPSAIAIPETPKAAVAAPKKPAAKTKAAKASKKPIAAAKRNAPSHEISAGL